MNPHTRLRAWKRLEDVDAGFGFFIGVAGG
jgi:hypothetical protein